MRKPLLKQKKSTQNFLLPATVSYDHSSNLAPDLPITDHLLMELVNHNLRFLLDRVLLAPQTSRDSFGLFSY